MRNRAKAKKASGFTLLEMLIVIGLLVIVTTVAVPKFKKCYNDILLDKVLDDLDSIVQSMRSYYLIMNQFPADEDPDRISEEVAWAMQPNFLGKKVGNYYNFTARSWKMQRYDWDFWYRDGFHPEWVTKFYDNTWVKYELELIRKAKTKFGNAYKEYTSGDKRGGFGIALTEIPKEKKENRYY